MELKIRTNVVVEKLEGVATTTIYTFTNEPVLAHKSSYVEDYIYCSDAILRNAAEITARSYKYCTLLGFNSELVNTVETAIKLFAGLYHIISITVSGVLTTDWSEPITMESCPLDQFMLGPTDTINHNWLDLKIRKANDKILPHIEAVFNAPMLIEDVYIDERLKIV